MPPKAAPVDRLPIICAAGKEPIHCESAGDLLRIYPKYDLAEKIVKQKEKLSKLKPGVQAAPVIPEANQLRDLISPDLNKSRFLEFKEEFYEKLYCKKVGLGMQTPTNSKPDYINNENRIFGRPNPKAESLYDVALPKKSPDEVLRAYVKWHDKYRISHGDYYPSERIQRGYNNKFDPRRTYGEAINADERGGKVKSLMEDFDGTSKMLIISRYQEDYFEQNGAQLGQPLRKSAHTHDPNKIYGRPAMSEEFHVKELLNKNITPSEITRLANESTYRCFAADVICSTVDCRGAAGRIESRYPRKRDCKLWVENLGEETTAKQLISPSIPTHFGLSHRDFMVPLSKDQIRRIFTSAGFDLKNDEFFEKVWANALTEWTSLGDQVSVEAFKFALTKAENEHK